MKTQFDLDGLTAELTKLGLGDEDDVELTDSQAEPTEPEKQPEPKEEEKPQEAEPEKVESPEAKEDRPAWQDDYADLKAKYDFLQGQVHRQAQPPAQAEAPRKRLTEITDHEEYGQRMEQMEQLAASSFNAIKQMESANASRAIAELKAEIPDIDQVIQPHMLAQGVDTRLQRNMLGADWKEGLLTAYDQLTKGKRHEGKDQRIKDLEAELAKAKDEVAAKRVVRQEQSSKIAARIPAGGGVFQESSLPQGEAPAGARGRQFWAAQAKAMEAALASHGG